MHSREVPRKVIIVSILCLALAGLTGMAGALDETHMKNQPGVQQFGAGGAGTGTSGARGATGALTASGGPQFSPGQNSGTGINMIGTSKQFVTGQGGATGGTGTTGMGTGGVMGAGGPPTGQGVNTGIGGAMGGTGTTGAMGAGGPPTGQGVNTGIGGGMGGTGTTGAMGAGGPPTGQGVNTGIGGANVPPATQPVQSPLNQPGTGTTGTTGTGSGAQYSCKDGICGARFADGTMASYNTKTGAGAMVRPDGSIVTGQHTPASDTTPATDGANVPPATQPAQTPPAQPGTGTGGTTGTGDGTTQYSCKDGICGARLADGTIVSYDSNTGVGNMVRPDGSMVTGHYQPKSDTTTPADTPAVQPASKVGGAPSTDTRSQYDKDHNICGWNLAGQPMSCPAGGPPPGWTAGQS